MEFSASAAAQCELCHGCHGHFSLPKDWKNEQARVYVSSLNVPLSSKVCRPCRDDATRVLSNPSHVPRWEKGKARQQSNDCCIADCSSTSVALTSIASAEELEHILRERGLNGSISVPTPLCKRHYHMVYDALTSHKKTCVTCGARLKSGSHRPCQQPDIIRAHLSENTGFQGQIHSSDHVCMSCYRSHQVILEHNAVISTDSDLRRLLHQTSEQSPTVDEVHTYHDVVNVALIQTVVKVGYVLLEKRALLLPKIHSNFRQVARTLLATKGMEEPPEFTNLSSRWLLSELIGRLQHHMMYSCKVRKYGTLIYRPSSDIVLLLTEAMWKLQNAEQATDEIHAPVENREQYADCTSAHSKEDQQDMKNINKLIHSQIRTFLSEDAHVPYEHDNFNLDMLAKKIQPELWEQICLLTRSQRESKGTSAVNDPTSPAYHIKKVRRLFLLCAILFCTDDRCSMPMHTLITDVVESQGGSTLLVRMLNRIGVCASADTLSRFIQHKVSTCDEDGMKYLTPDTFTVVSADNIDFMHSFARIFCGRQTSSWHGTTVQVATYNISYEKEAAVF